MAPTASEFKEVFDTDLTDSAANTWLDIAGDRLAPLDLSSLSTSEQDRLQIMLAAHYATAQDGRIEQASRDSGSVRLSRTSYGRIAMELDPTNSLGASRDSDRTIGSTGDD